jgi:hypothetical protein
MVDEGRRRRAMVRSKSKAGVQAPLTASRHGAKIGLKQNQQANNK